MVKLANQMQPKTKSIKVKLRVQVVETKEAKKEEMVVPHDPSMVMIHHSESINLACIINKIWNGNADTRLVDAWASFKWKEIWSSNA